MERFSQITYQCVISHYFKPYKNGNAGYYIMLTGTSSCHLPLSTYIAVIKNGHVCSRRISVQLTVIYETKFDLCYSLTYFSACYPSICAIYDWEKGRLICFWGNPIKLVSTFWLFNLTHIYGISFTVYFLFSA